MPSSYSQALRVELIGAGEQANTWGVTTNRNLGTVVEQSIAGVTVVDVTAGDVGLLALNGTKDQARAATLIITGTPAAAVTITLPRTSKLYDLYNKTMMPVAIRAGGQATYECSPTSFSRVIVDGASGIILGHTITTEVAAALRAPDLTAFIVGMDAAPSNSPTLVGSPTAPTAAFGTSSQQVANKRFVRENGVPLRVITLWYGSAASVPPGWVLCDGANGTPDLSAVFVLGAGPVHPFGTTGGSPDAVVIAHNHQSKTGIQSTTHSHSGTTDVAASHVHGGVITDAYTRGDADNETLASTVSGRTADAGEHSHSFITSEDTPDHTHGISTDGVDGAGKNMPPYYVMCFIMKIQA